MKETIYVAINIVSFELITVDIYILGKERVRLVLNSTKIRGSGRRSGSNKIEGTFSKRLPKQFVEVGLRNFMFHYYWDSNSVQAFIKYIIDIMKGFYTEVTIKATFNKLR